MSELRDARPELDERTDLSKCPIEECESPLVYPINWVNDYLPQGWDMSGGVVMCRCPNCEWRGVGFHDELTIYEFDKTLDEGTDTLISNLKLLARANMKDYVHFWVECIAKDKIMPMDIGPEPLSTQPLPPHGSYLVAINAIKNRSLGK